MADSAVLRSAMAEAITQATHLSLHTGDPAGTGENEVVGGEPAYARVPITSWAPGSVAGTQVATLSGSFNVPPNTEVTWAGLWNQDVYLDKASALASTVGQEIVHILSVVFVVAEPEPDPDGPGS